MSTDQSYSHIKPTPGRLAVKPVEQSTRTKGGLYLPDTVRTGRSVVGEIVAVPDDAMDGDKEMSSFFSVGQVVLFGQYNGSEITVGREKVIILLEKDIMAILEPEHPEDLQNAEIGDR